MANEQILVSGIEYKVRKLIDSNNLLREENLKLQKMLESVRGNLEKLQNELDIKNNEFLKLSLAKALESKFGVEKGIEIIDQMIEDVDRSIDVISQ